MLGIPVRSESNHAFPYHLYTGSIRWFRNDSGRCLGYRRYSECIHGIPGSSGPFGEELVGKWYDYPQAKEILKKHREDKMKLNEPAWTFWCDWHATF